MKYLPVHEIETPDNFYDASMYPGPGLYWHSGDLWVVATGSVSAGCTGGDPWLEAQASADGPAVSPKADQESRTDDLLLKVLAVQIDPELAFRR